MADMDFDQTIGKGAWVRFEGTYRQTRSRPNATAGDELHQLFVPSREASVVDVLIDASGAVLALLFLWTVRIWRKNQQD
jgi:hypothetical protein